MEFSDSNQPWRTIPHWVDFLIKFGFEWPNITGRVRRIALMSMPCDSAAAGLITLGSVLRDLGNSAANDIDGHYDALLAYAKQYLRDCKPCGLLRCAPDEKRCGHYKEAHGRLRSATYPRAVTISDATDFEERQLAWKEGNVVTRPTVNGALQWHIDGEPPNQLHTDSGALSALPYTALSNSAQIVPKNLRRSYSGLVLSGRTAGALPTREIYASLRFRVGSTEYRLDDLLTVFGWANSSVSRVVFYNPRTEQMDRGGITPTLVVADGGDSFLKVASSSRFQRSDIVGVIHRTMERERLEALGEKMAALRQWYVQDEDMLCGLPALPHGVSVSIVRRRN